MVGAGRAFLISLSLALFCPRVWAADVQTAGTPAEPVTSSDAQGAVDATPIVLALRGDALDAASLRAMLGEELGCPVVLEHEPAPATLGGSVTISYRRESRELTVTWDSGERTLTRVVTAPDDPERLLRESTLLAGNLARQQIDDLFPPEAPPAPQPPPPAPVVAPMPQPEPEVRPITASIFYPLATHYGHAEVTSNDELLQRATRAFTAETAESGPDDVRLQQTLLRLQRARRPAPERRRTLRTLYWTLATLFVGMGAWANATGRIDEWFESAPPPPAAAPPSPAAPTRAAPIRAAKPAARTSELPPVVEPPPVVQAPAVTPPEPPPAAPARIQPRSPIHAPPSVEPPRPATQPPAPQNVDDVYREAHRAHFNLKDYTRALPLWDRYLALAGPEHVLLPEARFNRAIALYRLGQWAEAKRALEPFAGGEYGRYRREDAERLLEALERQRR